MKHHFIFKGIALLLCAVSLLGIVGSGIGILTLSESNLYSKTVDQVIEERILSSGAHIAYGHAARYASIQLGGTPEALASRRFPHYAGVLRSYAYAIKDAEGNILEHSSMEGFENAKVYSFPISGQYIHTVNLLTVAEKYPGYEKLNPENVVETRQGNAYLYSAVPAEGAVVGQVILTGTDGETHDCFIQNCGTVFFTPEGTVHCLLPDWPYHMSHRTAIREVVLFGNDGTLLYQASSPRGIGYFTYSGDQTPLFVSTLEKDILEEVPVTEPETIPEETVPETTVETVPETTEATVPETTEPEISLYLEDNLPESKSAEVIRMKVLFDDDSTFEHTDKEGIGRVRHEDGTIVFSSYDSLGDLEEAAMAVRVRFWDADDELILEAEHPDGVGEFDCSDSGRLSYEANFALPVPAETTPGETEATEETVAEETVPETEATEETVPATEPVETTPSILDEPVPETTEPVFINGKNLNEFEINNEIYFDPAQNTEMYAEYVYTPIPACTVELYLLDDSLTYSESYTILYLLRENRSALLPVMGVSILLFLVLAIYLCFTAGHHHKSEEIRAGSLNRIPLDLYLVLGFVAVACLVNVAFEGGRYLIRSNLLLGCACAAGCCLAGCFLTVGFLFALVAQCKTPGGFWWRNSLCGRCVFLSMRFMVWLEKYLRTKGFPLFGRLCKRLWKLTVAAVLWSYHTLERAAQWTIRHLGRIFRWTGSKLHRFLSLIPLTWQWLLVGFCLIFVLIIGIDGFKDGIDMALPVSVLLSVATVLYVSHCYGVLAESTRRMSKGDLNTKVDDKLMLGCFKESAADLNALADVAVVAAQKQLKSERMKTELITNVSHDIKTPLTSIINYVDLLQKPHSEEEEQQYLEVLERQSQRLKKLIDDLMEMSKASTGNMNVDIARVDAVEAVNQALGEFADKLDKAQLIPVFRHDEDSEPMMADGRLVWRVMSNLLSNAVKYAMPGTRLYIDLARVDDKVIISLKNISRHELNMDAEELMERFVRGDDSRNTEGSGLGLNIARSLMELQKGSLQLLVDGDLFKVTLLFPGAEK